MGKHSEAASIEKMPLMPLVPRAPAKMGVVQYRSNALAEVSLHIDGRLMVTDLESRAVD